MAPLKTVCFAVGIAVATASTASPGSPVYSLQGGGSGMETKGDYLENKIARAVRGGSYKKTIRASKDGVNQAVKQNQQAIKDTANNLKTGAAGPDRGLPGKGKIDWPFEDKPVEAQRSGPLSWIFGANKVVAADEKKYLGNPNNAFVAQGAVALVFGALHLAKYDEFVGRLAEPLCKLVGLDWAAVGAVGPHVKLVGAYLAGVVLSNMLAYKSNSAGFKRGKIWHEMGSSIAISAVCIKELLSDKTADIVPHTVAAVLFAVWYAYLSQQY